MRRRKRGKLKFMVYPLHLVIGSKNPQDIGLLKYVAIPEHLRTFTIFSESNRRWTGFCEMVADFRPGARTASPKAIHVQRLRKRPSAVVRPITLPLSPEASMVQMYR
jgi:hypothetical protein